VRAVVKSRNSKLRTADCGLELLPSLPHDIRMLAKVCSAAVNGIEAYPIEVDGELRLG